MSGARAPNDRPCRRGIALPLLIVLLLALTLLGHGMLVLANAELQASAALRHAVRADLAASGALSEGIALVGLLPGPRGRGGARRLTSGWTGEGLWLGSGLRWLGEEFFLLEGEGRSRGWGGTRTVGAVGWALDPVTRVASFRGAMEIGGSLQAGGAGVEMSADPRAVPEAWDPEACAEYDPALDSIFGRGALPLTAPLPDSTSAGGTPGSGIPPLGLLPGPGLLETGDTGGIDLPGILPLPPVLGCPGWGDGVLLASRGDLLVRDRRICGVLVVDGTLRIAGTGSVQGLALVAGDLELEDSGRFEGMARVRGSIRLRDSAALATAACAALRALSDNKVLLEPLLLRGASRIPLHFSRP